MCRCSAISVKKLWKYIRLRGPTTTQLTNTWFVKLLKNLSEHPSSLSTPCLSLVDSLMFALCPAALIRQRCCWRCWPSWRPGRWRWRCLGSRLRPLDLALQRRLSSSLVSRSLSLQPLRSRPPSCSLFSRCSLVRLSLVSCSLGQRRLLLASHRACQGRPRLGQSSQPSPGEVMKRITLRPCNQHETEPCLALEMQISYHLNFARRQCIRHQWQASSIPGPILDGRAC